jgi:hypothetical protein
VWNDYSGFAVLHGVFVSSRRNAFKVISVTTS